MLRREPERGRLTWCSSFVAGLTALKVFVEVDWIHSPLTRIGKLTKREYLSTTSRTRVASAYSLASSLSWIVIFDPRLSLAPPGPRL